MADSDVMQKIEDLSEEREKIRARENIEQANADEYRRGEDIDSILEVLWELRHWELEKVGQQYRRFEQRFKLHHKIIYGSLVFLGVVLVWWGIWEFIFLIPVLSNPLVSLIAGVAVLAATGRFYKALFGVYLGS